MVTHYYLNGVCLYATVVPAESEKYASKAHRNVVKVQKALSGIFQFKFVGATFTSVCVGYKSTETCTERRQKYKRPLYKFEVVFFRKSTEKA